MNDGIIASWPAVIWSEAGGPIYARSHRLASDLVVMELEHNFTIGMYCTVILKLPKSRPDEGERFIRGRVEVVSSVLSALNFKVTFKWLEFKGDGEAILNEQNIKYREAWKKAS